MGGQVTRLQEWNLIVDISCTVQNCLPDRQPVTPTILVTTVKDSSLTMSGHPALCAGEKENDKNNH